MNLKKKKLSHDMAIFWFTTEKGYQKKDKKKKRQLHHATKPCHFKVIHLSVENDVITFDISAFKWPVTPIFYSWFLRFNPLSINWQKIIIKKVILGNFPPRQCLIRLFYKAHPHAIVLAMQSHRVNKFCWFNMQRLLKWPNQVSYESKYGTSVINTKDRAYFKVRSFYPLF